VRLRPDPFAEPAELVRRLYAYASYRLGPGPDAEDVVGETFERGLRFRASYDASRGAPVAWLLGIARRVIADRARQESGLLLADPPDTVGDPGHEERALDRLTLAAAVHRLDERDRELIALRYGADLTAKQIAHTFGYRTNAIEVALHRALARLRQTLEGEEDAGPPQAAGQAVRIEGPLPVLPTTGAKTHEEGHSG
jgi:RNA polymerase sigma-70 factor (ECF subfamily)